MKHKLKLYKEEGIEVVVDQNTGETFASISGTARMCNVNESSIRLFIKTSGEILIKSTEVITAEGKLRRGSLLNEEQILKCIAKYNTELLLKFAQLGLRKFLHTSVGYKHVENKSLYPDRSLEYKQLHKELKDLIKKTGGGQWHYIELEQVLNRIVGNRKGRSNNSIDELQNYAYCQLMRKAIDTGNTFFNKVKGVKTREAINKQLLILQPQIKQIQEALQVFE